MNKLSWAQLVQLDRQFESAIHKAGCEVWNEENLNRLQMEDLSEKLRKISVAYSNGTIGANEALAKVARLLKNTNINFLELLKESMSGDN